MQAYVIAQSSHDQLARAAFMQRGFTADEADAAARLCARATRHGIKTHSLLKALHLDDHFGTGHPKRAGCVPAAEIERLPSPFKATQKWDAHRKMGPAVAYEAMDTAMQLADEFGVGIVSVDSAFHYLWGGGYVMEAAERGYIAYTACTAALAEVVPFGGVTPTLGTNPHSWAFPTGDAIGFPIVIDWATSAIAMGKVQALARDGQSLPPDAALDAQGQPTTDPEAVAALKPFGAHKGYGLALIDELWAAFIGGSLPTMRSRPEQASDEEKTTPNFFFQVIHPDALDCGRFAAGRDRSANIKAVINDVLGHGNEGCLLPGQIEHQAAQQSDAAGGLVFTEGEMKALKQIAEPLGVELNEKAAAS
jgi:L-2-hydroxycarboxylate dehydrogenase (NAD+)